MARRYARDNRGRFSSTGATARGGRLRTASGGKRATVTAKASGPAAKGTISKAKRSKPSVANNIRPTGRPSKPANKISPITRKPKPTIKEKAKEVKNLMRGMDRTAAREALSSRRLDREIVRQSGGLRGARQTIQRRQQRAFNVQNGRNPQIGSNALYQYQSQLRELGSAANRRVPYSRKRMTPAQAKKAADKRTAVDKKRILDAINADLKASIPKPNPKRKRKP